MKESQPPDDDIPEEPYSQQTEPVQKSARPGKSNTPFDYLNRILDASELDTPGAKKLIIYHIDELRVKMDDANTEIQSLRIDLKASTDSYHDSREKLLVANERLMNLKSGNLVEALFIGLAGLLGGVAYSVFDDKPPHNSLGWFLTIVAILMALGVIANRIVEYFTHRNTE